MNKLPRSCALLLLMAGCTAASERTSQSDIAPAAPTHSVSITTPLVLQGLTMDASPSAGQPTTTPCSTCHGASDASALPTDPSALRGPHAGLTLRHGKLPCAACHDAARRDLLHLADGRALALNQAMELCAQCHGPQKRDYDHGAHGGMRGYWDLTRGPRERNHCVACHDPHGPAFGKFMPMPGPRDRFAPAKETHHD